MKHILIGIFLLYVKLCFAMEPGTVLENLQHNAELISFGHANITPEIKQKVVVKHKNQWVWAEVVGLVGNNCWVGVKKVHPRYKIGGLIKRYLISHVYNLEPNCVHETL